MFQSLKRTIGIAIAICCLFSISLAADNDCGLVKGTIDITKTEAYQKMVTNIQGGNYSAAYPAEAIRQAMANLKTFCCTNKKFLDEQSCVSVDKTRKVPESPFLYDHLIDIGFRRLDAFSDEATRYNLDPDPTGKERRDFITKAGDAKDGTTSKTIMDKYQTYRSPKFILPSNANSKDLVLYIDNYNDTQKASLRDKYKNMCQIVATLHTNINKDTQLVTDSFTKKCQALAQQRIVQENTYVKYIMIKKSNELLLEASKSYMQKYFVQEKLVEILSVITKVKSLFATLVQQAATSKSCSK